MAIRYIDTNFYKSPFIRGLKGSLKGLYSFIICDCTGAGIWAKDLEIASAYIGFKITEADFKIFLDAGKLIDLKDGRYFFPDFIEHQYPNGLSEKNPAQKNFIAELKKYDLLDSNLKIKKGLQSPSKGAQVTVPVTVMEEVTVMVPREEKKETKQVDETLALPFQSEKFIETWNVLISMKKWKKKEPAALQASLKKLSCHSESDAIQMMENSIAGEWQGIFELDKFKGSVKKQNTMNEVIDNDKYKKIKGWN